jgi:ankyrin repeat protein
MSLWNRLFGSKPELRLGIAERKSVQPNPNWNQYVSIDKACQRGDVEEVEALLKEHPGLAFGTDAGGWTLLHVLAYQGRINDAWVLLLVHKAVEVNSKDRYGLTALHIAAAYGKKDVAELLLSYQADANAKDDNGSTPLHWAARLVSIPQDPQPFDRSAEEERVLRLKKVSVAELLLANGADVNARSKRGVTPWDLAKGNHHQTMAELLCRQGGGQILDDIHSAVRNGDLEKVKALLRDHPSLAFSKDIYGWTPLHEAAAKRDKDATELLLASKAEVNAKNNDGRTPLHVAAVAYGATLELLLASNSEVNAKVDSGWTPLHAAAAAGYKETAELLLANGADINGKNTCGETALMLAEKYKCAYVAEFLRRHGAHE